MSKSYVHFRYINSPGGSVTAGLAIYDTMQLVSSLSSTHKDNFQLHQILYWYFAHAHAQVCATTYIHLVCWSGDKLINHMQDTHMVQACSMGSLLLAAGTQGMRHSLPNSR